MKKQTIIQETVVIQKLIPGGFGLGELRDGKKCLLLNALPGETVTEFRVTKNKSSYLEGVATKILNPAEFRVRPKDACFLSTSPWQILDFNYELKVKSEIVVELFREHGLEVTSPEVITDGQEYFYRNKMEYALYYDKEKAQIFPAFHARGTHQKIPLFKNKNTVLEPNGYLFNFETQPESYGSSLERPEILAQAFKIVAELNKKHEDARKYQSLLLRCNQKGEVAGGLFENGRPHPQFPSLSDQILGQTYSYSPNGFFQVNLPVYEKALLEIKQHLKSDQVLDLYAGVGTIGLSTGSMRDLTLVEVDRAAFFEMEQNVKIIQSQIDMTSSKIKPVLAKSEEILDLILKDQTVILDPPRAGCDNKLINRLLEVEPVQIIYLSCNPATQARDVKNLSPKYQIEKIKAFNFFPHTPHIENLVILKRKD